MKDLYNPNNNTINLAKLSLALKLETPMKDSNGSQSYSRGRSSSIVEDHASLNEIINLTLQKLKRKPGRIVGKLQPLERTTGLTQ